MNVGTIWGKLDKQERFLLYKAVRRYNLSLINKYPKIPKYRGIPFNKLIFLDLAYVIEAVEYYSTHYIDMYSKMDKLEILLKRLS